MKRYLTLLLLFVLLTTAGMSQQGISVASFKALPTDMTARITHSVIDQNGDKCALIKVVSTQKGFKWEGGMLGITKVVSKTAEYWVYVPYGAKKITIKHDQLGILRNYIYPEPIEEACVYEMVLTTGTVQTIVTNAETPTQWLIITSEPAGADVYVDEQYMGQTPFSKEFELGEHNYRLLKTLYYPDAGKIELTERDGRKEIISSLKPQFGQLILHSVPEEGAEVSLDGQPLNKTTPCTIDKIASGSHSLTLRRQWYEPKRIDLLINDGDSLVKTVEMNAAFAMMDILAPDSAGIFINDESMGLSRWEGRLMPGHYTIEARKQYHRTDKKQVHVIAGEDQQIGLAPLPITGVMKVSSQPFDADVFLDGVKLGKSPLTARDVLIGPYRLEIRKEGYASFYGDIEIKEGESLSIDERLAEGQEVTIASNPKGAELTINGTASGTTPKKLKLNFGKNTLKLTKEGYGDLEQDFHVTENDKFYEFKMIPDRYVLAKKNFEKYRKSKYIWMGVTAASAGAATFFYLQAESKYDEYQNATGDATDLHNQVAFYDAAWPVAAGVAAGSLIMTFIKSGQQAKAKSNMEMAVVPVGDGAMFCLTFNLH